MLGGAALALGLFGWASAASAADKLGVACQSPPPLHCPAAGDCPNELLGQAGNATDPKTGRRFFLDYPCDLKPGEKVVFILNIHGAGSSGAWQRHYFPVMDLKDRYRLVVATPTAAGSGAISAGAPPIRMWMADADDEHLRNIVELVYSAFGPDNIRAFWLAGHSQGGATSNRIVCTPFFRDKVSGWLSLSGGRLGPVQVAPGFLPAGPPGAPPPKLPGGVTLGAAAPLACDVNYIFETGQNEVASLPATSPLAERYACGPRVRRPDVVDDRPGYVFDSRQQGPARPAWGGRPKPGTAEVFVYPNCRSGRLVADVLRLDKGHTEGLEPKVTETLIRMMVEAPAR
jgi:hypothetical protein